MSENQFKYIPKIKLKTDEKKDGNKQKIVEKRFLRT